MMIRNRPYNDLNRDGSKIFLHDDKEPAFRQSLAKRQVSKPWADLWSE